MTGLENGTLTTVGVQRDTGSRFNQLQCNPGIGTLSQGSTLTFQRLACGTTTPTPTDTGTPTVTDTPGPTGTATATPPAGCPPGTYCFSIGTGGVVFPATTPVITGCND